VPTARLELAQLSPLPPQDSVSTNSTTSALTTYFLQPALKFARIDLHQRGITAFSYLVGTCPPGPVGAAGAEGAAGTGTADGTGTAPPCMMLLASGAARCVAR